MGKKDQDKTQKMLEEMQGLIAQLSKELNNPTRSLSEVIEISQRLNLLVNQHSSLLNATYANQENNVKGRKTPRRGRPLREYVLDILGYARTPLLSREIEDIGQAVFYIEVPSSRLASLRRDDLKAYIGNPDAKPEYLTPALSGNTLTAMPRFFTSSSWPLEDRIIGSRSLRVYLLKNLILICDTLIKKQEDDSVNLDALSLLVQKYSQTIVNYNDRFDPLSIKKSASMELSEIEIADVEERRAAAERAGKWSKRHLFWGVPVAIDGHVGELEKVRRKES